MFLLQHRSVFILKQEPKCAWSVWGLVGSPLVKFLPTTLYFYWGFRFSRSSRTHLIPCSLFFRNLLPILWLSYLQYFRICFLNFTQENNCSNKDENCWDFDEFLLHLHFKPSKPGNWYSLFIYLDLVRFL